MRAGGQLWVGGSSKKETGLLDKENSVVIVRGGREVEVEEGRRGMNDKGKDTIKKQGESH